MLSILIDEQVLAAFAIRFSAACQLLAYRQPRRRRPYASFYTDFYGQIYYIYD